MLLYVSPENGRTCEVGLSDSEGCAEIEGNSDGALVLQILIHDIRRRRRVPSAMR